MEEQLYLLLETSPSILLILCIIICLYTLGKGADMLVEEAVELSISWNIPKAIIGATIISIGTTLPEVAVSVMAAISGNPDLALGNAIGSIIADTGLIIGISSILGHLSVNEKICKFQGKIQFLLAIILVIICRPRPWGYEGNISRNVGFIFLALLIMYIYTSIKSTQTLETNDKEQNNTNDEFNVTNSINSSFISNSVWIQIFKLILGITTVIISSKILIPTVEITALRAGIPQGIIAATLIAFGTSLPELVTSITAVTKGHGDLAVGNIVGADILNILFVIGASATVTPSGLTVPTSFHILQLPAMLAILIIFRFFSRKPTESLSKIGGFILLSFYIIYLILNFIIIK